MDRGHLAEAVTRMDAGAEQPWMASQRVSARCSRSMSLDVNGTTVISLIRFFRNSVAQPEKTRPRDLYPVKQAENRQPMMKKYLYFVAPVLLLSASTILIAGDDSRQMVQLSEMMQQHMMSNMRDHLQTLNEILINLADGELDKAAELAESRLGMSSLELHGASHMGKFMPDGMSQAGTSMHRAASLFALKAQEGDVSSSYKALTKVTSACVSCHSSYRIR